MRSGPKCPMIDPWPCAYACAYVDPVFTSQSYDMSTSTGRTNLSVFLFLMLMLMLTQLTFACAYVYALVKTNHLSGPLRKHKLTSTGSKDHGL